MRTLNVKSNSTKIQVLNQVATTLENDILDDENLKGSFSCEIDEEEGKVTQYELDNDGEIFNEVVWHVDTDIDEAGLSNTVNIDC